MQPTNFVHKHPGPLQVLVIVRSPVADTGHTLFLNDPDGPFEKLANHAKSVTSQPMQFITLLDLLSGPTVEPPMLFTVAEMVATASIDLIICEDLNSLCCSPRKLQDFVEAALSKKTHVITVNDGLDTRNEEWESAFMAAFN